MPTSGRGAITNYEHFKSISLDCAVGRCGGGGGGG